MLLNLLLVRHAKSSWANPNLSDFDRPLNKRGKHNAPLMGKRINGYEMQIDTIISSPARRAKETAKLIGKEVDLVDTFINDSRYKIYIYGKKDIREDRKMGHINRIIEKNSNIFKFMS